MARERPIKIDWQEYNYAHVALEWGPKECGPYAGPALEVDLIFKQGSPTCDVWIRAAGCRFLSSPRWTQGWLPSGSWAKSLLAHTNKPNIGAAKAWIVGRVPKLVREYRGLKAARLLSGAA